VSGSAEAAPNLAESFLGDFSQKPEPIRFNRKREKALLDRLQLKQEQALSGRFQPKARVDQIQQEIRGVFGRAVSAKDLSRSDSAGNKRNL